MSNFGQTQQKPTDHSSPPREDNAMEERLEQLERNLADAQRRIRQLDALIADGDLIVRRWQVRARQERIERLLSE